MCLLAYCEHDATPNYSGLEVACKNNPDGFGWAIHTGGHIVVGRAMDQDLALETYQEALGNHPGCPSMFHARWATHGSVALDNCHPFWVGASRDTLLAHNGVISDGRIPKGMSDTRWFAEVELPRRGLQILDKPGKTAKLERYLASKVVVFTTREDLKYGVYILNERHGEWVDGVWWSNDSYLYEYKWVYGTALASATSSEDEGGFDNDRCPQCGMDLTEEELHVFGYCLTCEVCLDCHAMFGDCLCFQGRAATTMAEDAEWSAWDRDAQAIALKSIRY